MGLKIKDFNIFEVHWKIQFLVGGLPKKGVLDSLKI